MKNRLVLRIFFVTLITAPLLKAMSDSSSIDPTPFHKLIRHPSIMPLDPKTAIEQKIRDAARSSNSMKNSLPGNLDKQNESEPEPQTNVDSKEQDKTTEKKGLSILDFRGILPESVARGTTEEQLKNSGDEIKGSGKELEEKTEKLSTLFGISFDKKQLMYYGAGAVAIVVFCGVTYVLYKNGTLKKIGDYIGNYVVEHKFKASAAVGTAAIFALAGIYAKQRGITVQDTSTWITSFWN